MSVAMAPETSLRLAFLFNIAVLAPVVFGLVRAAPGRPLAVFEGKADDSPPLRWLLISLWGTILAGSVAGTLDPTGYRLILLGQIVYKSAWLLGYALPVARARGPRALPWGVTGVFLFIVTVWPLLLFAS